MGRLIFPLILGLGGAAILVSLGIWQVQRLQWKQAVLAEIDARIAAAPVALPASLDPEADRFQPVEVEGTFTGEELHVLASSKSTGAIYRVIAAFQTDDGRRVLVDRGGIPTPKKDSPRPTTAATVTGNLHWPDEIDGFTPDPDIAANIWFARDVPEMSTALSTEEVLIVSRSPTGDGTTPMPVDSSGIPNDHLEYAVTWFGLALVWLAMTGYWVRKRLSEEAP